MIIVVLTIAVYSKNVRNSDIALDVLASNCHKFHIRTSNNTCALQLGCATPTSGYESVNHKFQRSDVAFISCFALAVVYC